MLTGFLYITIPMLAAFAVSYGLTPLVARLACRSGAVDRPNARSVSKRDNMPLWGGLAVFGGLVAGAFAALLSFEFTAYDRLLGLLAGALLLVILGLVDDRRGMGAWPKFAVQVLAAGLAIGHGYAIDRLTDPITLSIVVLPSWLAYGLSVLWIVGITNAINLLDGLDGLASGVGAIIAGTLTVIAFQSGNLFGVCVGASLVGALLGFLPHNFSPARIFLGDTGSLLIGFTLSLLAIDGQRRISLLTFVVPLLALAVPIMDTTLSIVRRIRSRKPIFLADRLHMHHRLLAVEGSARAAVLQFYFVTGAFCLIALSFTQISGFAAGLFLLAVVALTLRLLWNLGALSFEGEGDDGSRAMEEEH